ncbi:hypothetical protein STEG23_020893 [Scotinomys teguina]
MNLQGCGTSPWLCGFLYSKQALCCRCAPAMLSAVCSPPSGISILDTELCRSQKLIRSSMGSRGSWNSDPMFSEAVTFPAEPVKLVSLNE